MSYSCLQEFLDLYHVYTGDHSAGADTIGTALTNKIAATAEGVSGPLIIINNSHVMIYSNDNQRIGYCDYRASLTNGFYEMTAISHIGPALMSLSLLNEKGVDVSPYLNRLKDGMNAVKSKNDIALGSGENWLDQLNLDAWQGMNADIQKMVSYACNTAIAYIDKVLASDNYSELNTELLQENLFQANDNTNGIGYNSVMVSTFVLSALAGIQNVYDTVKDISAEDWQQAGVVIQSFAGEINNFYLDADGNVDASLQENAGYGSRRYLFGNLTAGLTSFTNWFVPLLFNLSKRNANPQSKYMYNLKDDHVFIVPYATLLDTSAGVPESLPAFDWNYYKNIVWRGLYFRGSVAGDAMSMYDFPDNFRVLKWGYTSASGLEFGQDGIWPGDYGVDSVEDFMKRIKHSFSDVREMLSNSVGFWVGSAFAANNFQVEGMKVPGLTGVNYPELES